ncbi:MAG: 50S ribosomal protein L2 [Fibrobacterota bacterium]|nr:50S ribosomal protein L2 [Fibrobacterota bacterium]QQS06857.1 MAG: 50S ribosomal protein L2 [Fibrobacterota bacterium]
MALKSFNPLTPVLRTKTVSDFAEITTDKPFKALTEGKKRTGGRNAQGRITSRRRGGGAKQAYRKIDFRRDRLDVPAVVETIEYDPNRTARIALIKFIDGQRRYILAPLGLKVGAKVITSATAPIEPGNVMPLEKIPLGTQVHNIELTSGRGGQIVRSAGGVAEVASREDGYVTVKLPSGEYRRVLGRNYATIGQVGNLEHENISLGSAGRARHMGRRPKVRGVVMNPVDHPMGGGEGKTSGGRQPVSPWGKKAKGGRTRNNKRTDKFIVRSRHAK